MSQSMVKVGLRIDVDTFRGTRQGVPVLLRTLAHHHILATFYFSLGPDNMGRHLWRLLKPAFLIKMLRSNAASLYGWDILLCGTLWPGRKIGHHLADVIKATQKAGHEVGLHAWDHHKWQARMETMSPSELNREIRLGFDALRDIVSAIPPSSASAGWKCNESTLLEKESFGFRYNSDCRGTSIFRPVVDNRICAPQIPVTLPTYDEMIGRNNITDANYNDVLLDMIEPERLNVLTIHAEVEGGAKSELFNEFLNKAKMRNISFVSLGSLLPEDEKIPCGTISLKTIAGREGTLCLQHGADYVPLSNDFR